MPRSKQEVKTKGVVTVPWSGRSAFHQEKAEPLLKCLAGGQVRRQEKEEAVEKSELRRASRRPLVSPAPMEGAWRSVLTRVMEPGTQRWADRVAPIRGQAEHTAY